MFVILAVEGSSSVERVTVVEAVRSGLEERSEVVLTKERVAIVNVAGGSLPLRLQTGQCYLVIG